jgi:hypothetical protein
MIRSLSIDADGGKADILDRHAILLQLDVEPDPVTAQRITLLVADVRVVERAIVVRVGIMLQYLFSVKVIHVRILLYIRS